METAAACTDFSPVLSSIQNSTIVITSSPILVSHNEILLSRCARRALSCMSRRRLPGPMPVPGVLIGARMPRRMSKVFFLSPVERRPQVHPDVRKYAVIVAARHLLARDKESPKPKGQTEWRRSGGPISLFVHTLLPILLPCLPLPASSSPWLVLSVESSTGNDSSHSLSCSHSTAETLWWWVRRGVHTLPFVPMWSVEMQVRSTHGQLIPFGSHVSKPAGGQWMVEEGCCSL